jgi:hypothetical protein
MALGGIRHRAASSPAVTGGGAGQCVSGEWNEEEAENGVSVGDRGIWMNAQFTIYYSNIGMSHEFGWR